MTRNRIYRRVFIPYVIVLLLALGAAWLAATQLFSETLEKRLQTQLIHTVELLSKGTFPYTPSLLSKLSRLIRADIVLLDHTRHISISTPNTNLQQLQQHFNTLLTDSTNTKDSLQKFELAGHDYLLFWKKVPNLRDRRVSYIAAFSDLSDIHDTNQRTAKWLGLGAVSGLLMLAWVGHLISQSITIPIRELAHMAREIAMGKRSIRAKIHRSDEIGDLAATLNTMAEKLIHYDSEIARQSRMAALGQMTARIAHEIRNPLTAIKMQLQLLKETAGTQNQPILASLLDETRRLELIVLSTLQHKKIARPVFSYININSLIDEIMQLLRPQFEHQGLLLTQSFSSDLPDISLDRDMMTQILLNLLLNAKDEMPDGGEIRLSTGIFNNKELWFAVEDSGTGIAEENWPNLFSDSSSAKADGFGLGLKLCHELVELHNGQIEIGHSNLGGARFLITLPLTGLKQ